MDEANRRSVRVRVTEHLGHSVYRQRGRRPSRSWHLVIAAAAAALVLSSAARSQATSSCPSGPQYSNTRYDDDFSYLRNPACRNDFLDPLKFISLNARPDWYLSLGGEIRERYERFHNPLWGQQPQSPGGYLLQRYFLFGDLHLGENVRIFSELMSDWENYRVGGPRPPIDQDQLDFTQFFVDLKLHPFGSDTSLTLRVGEMYERRRQRCGQGTISSPVVARSDHSVHFAGRLLLVCRLGERVGTRRRS
jgi:Alginate export